MSKVSLTVTSSPSNITEVDVRAGAVQLALVLHGEATWNFVDTIRGCSVVAGTGSTLVVSHAQQLHPQELRLILAPMPTFDPHTDTSLSIAVSHLCGSSLLSMEQVAPCVSMPGSEDAASTAAGLPLTARLAVLSGGSPPGRPGAPRIVPLDSYNAVGVQWEAPRAGPAPGGYVWIEPGHPHWPVVLSGNSSGGSDDRPLAVLHGFGRGATLLPGSVAGVGAGGYSQPSVAWVGGVFGEPAPPLEVTLTYVAQAPGTSLRLRWRLPEGGWGGGFAVRHHRLTLWTTDGDGDAQLVASSLRVALNASDDGEARTESEAAALAAALAEAAADDETTGAELGEASPAVTPESAAEEVEVAVAVAVEVQVAVAVAVAVEVGADGGCSLLLKGLSPGSRYAAQLVAVNSAGDESVAPTLCGAAARTDAVGGAPCAPEATVPTSTVSWCGYSEEELDRCSRLVLTLAVVAPLMCAAALGFCLWWRTRTRRRCFRRATTAASAPGATDGTALPAAQTLPPSGRAAALGFGGHGGAGDASPRQQGHASARWNGRLRAATRPIWRVFAPGPQNLAEADRVSGACSGGDDAASESAMPTARGAAKTAKEISPQIEPTAEEPTTLSV